MKKTKEEISEIAPVPELDINAAIKAPIEESTGYETGITPKNRFLYILGWFGFLCIVLVSGGIIYFYLTDFKGVSENKSVNVVKSPVVQQAATPAFNRANITFEVLNGSGVAGAAKKAGDSVTSLGYQVVQLGNASIITGNKLYLNQGSEPYSSQILSDLSGFNISTVSGELTDGTASAKFVIGK